MPESVVAWNAASLLVPFQAVVALTGFGLTGRRDPLGQLVCDRSGGRRQRRGCLMSRQANFHDLAPARQERINTSRVEFDASLCHKIFARDLDGHRLFVRPLGRKRVEHIGDRNDARRNRNLELLEAARISAAVPTFVMRGRDGGRELDQFATRSALTSPASSARESRCTEVRTMTRLHSCLRSSSR
jgi:hypothetical protein